MLPTLDAGGESSKKEKSKDDHSKRHPAKSKTATNRATPAHLNIFIFILGIRVIPILFSICGGGEIRTHDAFRHGGFRNRWNKPLSDASAENFSTFCVFRPTIVNPGATK